MQRSELPIVVATGLAVLLAVAALALALPAPLSACSIMGPPPALVGAPAHDERDVPTDVVLTFKMVFLAAQSDDTETVPGSYTLEDAAGAAVEFASRRVGRDVFEIEPAHALEPMTEYVLHAEWISGNNTYSDELHFITGAGPSTVPPGPPEAQLDQYLADGPSESSCTPPGAGACVIVEGDSFYEVAVLDPNGNAGEPSLSFGPYFVPMDLSGAVLGKPSCVRLRARGANGTLGAETTVCGDDFPVQRVDGEDLITVSCASTGLRLSTWSSIKNQLATDAGADAGTDASTTEPDAGATADDMGTSPDQPDAAQTDMHASGCALVPQPARSQAWAAASTLMVLALFRRRRR